MSEVRFAIPKGSLWDETIKLLTEAGYEIKGSTRTYRPWINDPQIKLKVLRPQEIPIYVGEGSQDIGITGLDWIRETNADVEVLLNLEYGFVELVIAASKDWEINDLSEALREKIGSGEDLRISTEYLNLSSRYVMSNPVYKRYFGEEEPVVITPWWQRGVNERVKIFLSFGATEAKPPEDSDLIIDVTGTGTTLEQNNLKKIEVIMESQAVLIANRDSLKTEKREKILDVYALLKGVIEGRKKIHIFVNVKEENLKRLIEILPALKAPTISPLSVKGWYSLNTVIDKAEFLKVLPHLRRLAQGLVVFEPRQIMALSEE